MRETDLSEGDARLVDNSYTVPNQEVIPVVQHGKASGIGQTKTNFRAFDHGNSECRGKTAARIIADQRERGGVICRERYQGACNVGREPGNGILAGGY